MLFCYHYYYYYCCFNPFNNKTCFHIHSAYYLVILYSFTNLCGD
ncbi:hypothetical protein E2C01_031379 [Portunus trituberculatus]|uniref:Uncharacterized protein n=1 Tax=Portunus trituberculatus TaxID=210409 RepID=A0A5B7EWN7_PORTR|nr:hypothetical protein [Portunus trituberculatus]